MSAIAPTAATVPTTTAPAEARVAYDPARSPRSNPVANLLANWPVPLVGLAAGAAGFALGSLVGGPLVGIPVGIAAAAFGVMAMFGDR